MIQKNTLQQFLRFGIAGGIGFLVDVAVLYLCIAAGSGFLAGRAVSFVCATVATWQINRNFAFRDARRGSLWQQWWHYLFVVLGGGLVNYLVSALLVLCLPASPWLPVVSVALGSLAGMLVNFFNTRLFVFKRHKQTRPK